jgi:hypothetical protein
MLKQHKLLLPIKSNEVASFEKKCNELLVICYRILNVMVLLDLQVTAI